MPIRLMYDNTSTDVRPALAMVFGHLVKLVTPTLTGYHSDLYHDAIWLDRNASGDTFTFFYSYNGTGTHIGTDHIVAMVREHGLRLTIANTRGEITLEGLPREHSDS